jgi:hypothetical protein
MFSADSRRFRRYFRIWAQPEDAMKRRKWQVPLITTRLQDPGGNLAETWQGSGREPWLQSSKSEVIGDVL